MGFLKAMGKIAGNVAGLVIGTPVFLAGEVIDSDLLREIGGGAYKVTAHTGELLGSVIEGVVETVYGTVKKDSDMQSEGFEKVIESGGTYIKGVGKGMIKMAEDGLGTVAAIIGGDTDKAVKMGSDIAKTITVGVLAVGIVDVFDGMDAFDYIENPNVHHVTPYVRLLPDDTTIWVDGDGDTSVDTYGSWIQSNPDYKA